MSKPSAVRQDARHVAQRPVNSLLGASGEQKAVATGPMKGSTHDPNFPIVVLTLWWKKLPDPLLPPRIARTDTEWPGEWYLGPSSVQFWDEQKHEWTSWWKASYALPLTRRVIGRLERIRTLPQEEW